MGSSAQARLTLSYASRVEKRRARIIDRQVRGKLPQGDWFSYRWGDYLIDRET